jgi:hypothetical protein
MHYITGINGMRYRILAGPYKSAQAASADIERAEEAAATYHNGSFDRLEVESIKDFAGPAALNLRGFQSAG